MIWSRKAHMHWVYSDVEGLIAEVFKVKNAWVWKVTNAKNGTVLTKRKADHPIDAMDEVKNYITSALGVGDGIKS